VALAGVYVWARTNTSFADREHELLIVATLLACAPLSVLVIVARLVDPSAESGFLRALSAAALGTVVAVAASSASTLLTALAIAPATDPHEFGRPLFRVAYVGALALSACAGAGGAAAARGWRREARVLLPTMFLTLALTAGAWAYLAVGSSEFNQCVVDDEFPLQTNHVCSGY
jgi:hypothetical protein